MHFPSAKQAPTLGWGLARFVCITCILSNVEAYLQRRFVIMAQLYVWRNRREFPNKSGNPSCQLCSKVEQYYLQLLLESSLAGVKIKYTHYTLPTYFLLSQQSLCLSVKVALFFLLLQCCGLRIAFSSCLNGSFLECSPPTEEARFDFRLRHVSLETS